jgi:glyoxylase-like metal-dependent hydrolase (beta-lactamase superfamily II)
MTNAAASILVLLANNPSPLTGRGTNTYVVGEDEVVVIDPGPADADHLHRVQAAVAERGRATSVVITHHHFDHSEAATEVAQRLGAPLAGFPHPDSPVLDRELADGDEVAFGGGFLHAVHTPGHSRDHLCFWLPEAGTVFAGDLVAGEGYIVIDPPDGDMTDYLDSLRRVGEIGATTIRPGHGPLIDAPHAYLQAYLAHRLEREAKVLASVETQPRTVGELLPLAYDDTPEAMFPVAARSLLAHLEKLAHEGKVEVVPGAAESAYALPGWR